MTEYSISARAAVIGGRWYGWEYALPFPTITFAEMIGGMVWSKEAIEQFRDRNPLMRATTPHPPDTPEKGA